MLCVSCSLSFVIIPASRQQGSIFLLSYLRVCELAPIVLGRGRYPPPFGHTCVLVAGIHPKGNQDGFPIKNVGNDGEGEGLPINIVGNVCELTPVVLGRGRYPSLEKPGEIPDNTCRV